MKKEFIRKTGRSVTLNVTAGKIDSFREIEKTTGTVRVYENGCIGVAGCLGEPNEKELTEKAKEALAPHPNASVAVLDMVREKAPDGLYDAALDCMGLHMLVTDSDRSAYLQNACAILRVDAPMLFFRESYRKNAYEGEVGTFEDWKRISGDDYSTPMKRTSKEGIVCEIPLVAARARTEKGYRAEMENAGFSVLDLIEMDINEEIPFSASIFVKKGI